MLDFVLGLFLAGLLVRGWMRGFVREILDLVALIAGLWVALNLSGPLGEFITERFAVSPEIATIGAGIVLGLAAGAWASRFLATLLYALEPRDPGTLMASAATLALIGAVAGWLPAIRASRLDPTEVLREI